MEKRRVVNQKDRSELRTFSTAPHSPIISANTAKIPKFTPPESGRTAFISFEFLVLSF